MGDLGYDFLTDTRPLGGMDPERAESATLQLGKTLARAFINQLTHVEHGALHSNHDGSTNNAVTDIERS